MGGGSALSVRAIMDHPRLRIRPATQHISQLDADSGASELILGVVEGLLEPVEHNGAVEPNFEVRIEYRDADEQWWATTARFWVGAQVPGLQTVAAHVDDQSEQTQPIHEPRPERDIVRGEWEEPPT